MLTIVSNSNFCFASAISSSMSLLMRAKLDAFCWCCFICLLHYNGDGFAFKSVLSVFPVMMASALLDFCASAFFVYLFRISFILSFFYSLTYFSQFIAGFARGR